MQVSHVWQLIPYCTWCPTCSWYSLEYCLHVDFVEYRFCVDYSMEL